MDHNGYRIVGDGTFGQHLIKNIGAGTIPRVLSGCFTSVDIAKRTIDAYVSNKAIEETRIAIVRSARPEPCVLKQPKEMQVAATASLTHSEQQESLFKE